VHCSGDAAAAAAWVLQDVALRAECDASHNLAHHAVLAFWSAALAPADSLSFRFVAAFVCHRRYRSLCLGVCVILTGVIYLLFSLFRPSHHFLDFPLLLQS